MLVSACKLDNFAVVFGEMISQFPQSTLSNTLLVMYVQSLSYNML